MRLLLHTCCAPCSVQCIEQLGHEGITPTLFWYNPTIHPVTEYRSRRDAFIGYAQSIGMEYILQDEYGLRTFIEDIYPNFDQRCAVCYRSRLERTALYATQNGYDVISTTLLISPYQNHELICEIAHQLADQYNVEFLYRDFRPGFRAGQSAARALGLYMQKYCGCIFSEEERYLKR